MSNADFIKQKAREISYALIRVCFYIKRQDLKSLLEKSSFELLEKCARFSADNTKNNFDEAEAVVSVLDGLVRLGHSIYEIEPVNATILVRELDGLNSAIWSRHNVEDPRFGKTASGQFGNPSLERESLDLEGMFSKVPAIIHEEPGRDKQSNGNVMDSINVADFDTEQVSQDEQVATPAVSINNVSLNAAMRQSAIINRIKESSTSRLKDLMTGFSGVSERTLRYDLQRLCGQGVIERVGNGGPASYYKMLG